MRHAGGPPPVLESNQECTVICSTCNTTTTTLLTTPFGLICPGCYKRIVIKPKQLTKVG